MAWAPTHSTSARTTPAAPTPFSNWCTPDPTSPEALGIDPLDPVVEVFRSIRWHLGGDGIDLRLEIPVPSGAYETHFYVDYTLQIPIAAGEYTVRLYFCEACCPNRHFEVDIQGTTVFPDVSVFSCAGGAMQTAGFLEAEDVEVGDGGLLEIRLLPCADPECPGGTDGNAILSLLEVFGDEIVEPPMDTFVRGVTDSDGSINLTDGVRTLDFLSLGGPAPSPSATTHSASDCGPDGTADGMDCAVRASTRS
jgi:hypothetical protein